MEQNNTQRSELMQDGKPVKKKFRRRPIWTGGLVVAWVLLAIVVILTHVAVDKLVPPIRDLPSNVLRGFNEVLKFNDLEQDGITVSDHANVAMGCCLTLSNSASTEVEIVAARTAMTANGECVLGQAKVFSPMDKQTVTKEQLDGINAAFSSTLGLIKKVTTDKCLASEGFDATAKNLNEITDFVSELKPVMTPCLASWPMYCGIYHSGKALAAGSADASKEINKLADSDNVKKLSDHLSYLRLLHGLPYLLVLYMVFFTAFWYNSGGVCCCCEGGHIIGCLFCLTPSMVLWLTYFILSCVVVALGFIIRHFAKKEETAVGASDCTLAELITHIEVTYTEFYDLAFKDLLGGLVLFDNAFRASLFLCLVMGLYATCVCLRRPYHRETKSSREMSSHVLAKE